MTKFTFVKTATMRDLDKFMRINSLKQKDITDYLGCSRMTVYSMLSNKTRMSDKFYRMLLDNPYGWDITPLTCTVPNVNVKTSRESVTNVNIGSGSISSAPQVAPVPATPVGIPIIPSDAHAGSLGDFADGVMPYQCETIVSPYPQAVCAIKVCGDSMEPRYPANSILFLKKVNEKIFVEWGRSYVLDTENGAVLKIVNKSENPEEIICQSINEKYQPFEIGTQYIHGWYRVLGTLITE